MRLSRTRWPMLVTFTVLAALFFWIGRHSLSRDLASAFGFVFLGALITYAVGVSQEQRRETADATAARHRDLDETRRLTYMALVARRTSVPDLVATVGNALAHHGLGVPFDEAATHVAAMVDGGPYAESDTGPSEQWLRDLVERITKELDGETRA